MVRPSQKGFERIPPCDVTQANLDGEDAESLADVHVLQTADSPVPVLYLFKAEKSSAGGLPC